MFNMLKTAVLMAAITALFVIERLWTSKLFEGPSDGAISQVTTE